VWLSSLPQCQRLRDPDCNSKAYAVPLAIGKLPTSQAGLESLAVGGEDLHRGRHLYSDYGIAGIA
jgi:hypothetical protein